jgi:hypothetical protein
LRDYEEDDDKVENVPANLIIKISIEGQCPLSSIYLPEKSEVVDPLDTNFEQEDAKDEDVQDVEVFCELLFHIGIGLETN